MHLLRLYQLEPWRYGGRAEAGSRGLSASEPGTLMLGLQSTRGASRASGATARARAARRRSEIQRTPRLLPHDVLHVQLDEHVCPSGRARMSSWTTGRYSPARVRRYTARPQLGEFARYGRSPVPETRCRNHPEGGGASLLSSEGRDIMLVRLGETMPGPGAESGTIEQGLGRDVNDPDSPLPKSRSIEQAHDADARCGAERPALREAPTAEPNMQ